MQLYKHQQEATEATVPVLQYPGSRATLSMACGTGKTLTSIRIGEQLTAMTPDAKIIVFVPSLALSDQLMRSWIQYAFNGQFKVLPVSSEGLFMPRSKSGNPTILANTTDSKEVENALRTKGRLIVFCTYQSAEAVKTATGEIPGFSFDFAVMDEAHRTAGGGKDKSSSYLMCLQDGLIPIKRRLFITATPKVRRMAENNGMTERFRDYGYSMSDKSIYGDVVYQYPFSAAISDGMLADYRIWAVMITNQNIREAAQVDSRIDLTGVASFKNPEEKDVRKVASAKHLAITAAVARMFQQGTVTGAITFHQERENSMLFSDNASTFLRHSEDRRLADAYLAHVDGNTPQRERRKAMSEFSKAYAAKRFAMLSNCAVFTEGVDVPELDTVVFVDNKTSEISIVQAVGRAVRLNKKNPNKVANVIIPVFLDNDEDPEGEINGSPFRTLFNVITSLRESDNMEVMYAKAIMREALHGAGYAVDDDTDLIGAVDAEGNHIAGAQNAPVMLVAPEETVENLKANSIMTASYKKLVSYCEATLIGYSSVFERNLGNLKAYKELKRNRDLIGSDQPFSKFTIGREERVGNFPIGKEMQKVRDAFDAGILSKHEEKAYAELGFDLTPIDDIADELIALAASFAS